MKNAKMSAHAKKRKSGCRKQNFQTNMDYFFFFTEVKGKPVCLVSGEHVAVFKEYNLKRHYETKHAEKYKNLTDAEQARTSTDLIAKLEKQQGCFTKLHAARDAATRTSFVIAHKIAQDSKPFSEEEFVKECMVESAALLCPEKKEAFENIPLSRRTLTRRVEDIAENLEFQLQSEMGSFDFFSLALDT
ncbi:hypothetical protein F2P81_005989 [Scophthalmus maximus]|uniref:SPIN-DOC-like zinc-finger domain-containing protein n=1 Tax=Scophthalmus maximus TaxID=52904 RepID=A0A6A4T814_SCOMX|nr:hypothetical protein F2P81_005989 [Scophthalmus maximus]